LGPISVAFLCALAAVGARLDGKTIGQIIGKWGLNQEKWGFNMILWDF